MFTLILVGAEAIAKVVLLKELLRNLGSVSEGVCFSKVAGRELENWNWTFLYLFFRTLTINTLTAERFSETEPFNAFR